VIREVTAGIALVVLLAASLLASVALGAVPIPLSEVVATLGGGGDATSRQIVMELRLPRGILALLVGGGLAMAGATFQALLRNPLAEPYILGISGGAAVGAVLVLTLGWTTQGSWALPLAAFAGAMLAILLVFTIARRADRSMDVRVLLLAGVVVGAFFSAVIALILALADATSVRSAVIWMMGSLAGADWTRVSVVAAYTLPAALLLMGLARTLNLLALGEETASVLGADVERVKLSAFVVASLVTAVGVGVAGVIGFGILLPLSFLAGGTFLAWADLVARTLVAPTELPIGVVTAFVGVPLFLVLLRRSP